MRTKLKIANGFSMIELLFATFIFTVIAGTIFSLLLSSQLRYQGESNLTNAFQQANVAIDQITRDVHSAGFPPASSFSTDVNLNYPERIALPFSWLTGYPFNSCVVGATCGGFPGEDDLILETDTGDGRGVQWIRYSLQGTNLMRGTAPKLGTNPVAATDSQLIPYLENVTNGANAIPLFTYSYDPGLPQQPVNIRQVNICLMVQSAKPNVHTGQLETITVTGQAVRFNPNQ